MARNSVGKKERSPRQMIVPLKRSVSELTEETWTPCGDPVFNGGKTEN